MTRKGHAFINRFKGCETMAVYNLGRVGFVVKGEYSASTAYKRLDVVTMNDNVYCAVRDVPVGTVPTNTSYWSQLINESNKLEKNLGAANAGKVLVVKSNGDVGVDVIQTDATLSQEGQAADAKAVGDALLQKSDTDHNHAIDQVVGLQNQLDGKSNLDHTHVMADVSGIDAAFNAKADVVHDHEMNDVNGLSAALNDKANKTHNHIIADVAGLEVAMNNKSDIGHTHTINNIASLQESLNLKANSDHSHAINDVTGLSAALDAKSDDGHTHGITDITGLANAMSAKQDKLTAGKNIVLNGNTISAQVELNVPLKTSQLTNDSGFITDDNTFGTFEELANKVSSITSASDDDHYPSAKAVFDVAKTKANTQHQHVKSDIVDFPDIPAVVNNLTSTSETSALSAVQGKNLNDRIVPAETITARIENQDGTCNIYNNDVNDINVTSLYQALSTCQNIPTAQPYFISTMISANGALNAVQNATLIGDENPLQYTRSKVNGAWNEWQKIGGQNEAKTFELKQVQFTPSPMPSAQTKRITQVTVDVPEGAIVIPVCVYHSTITNTQAIIAFVEAVQTTGTTSVLNVSILNASTASVSSRKFTVNYLVIS